MKETVEIPVVCRYCGGKIVYTTTHQIYEKSDEPIYLCTNCNAYVGCHKGTKLPYGKVANAALRMKRREVHIVFDTFWRARGWGRTNAYRWMAQQMDIPEREAHIGNFEMDQCEKLIALCHREMEAA